MYIVVVSGCRHSVKKDEAVLEFNGEFNGQKINKIQVQYDPEKHCLVKGREYIVHLEVHNVKCCTIYGVVERVRDLDEVLEEF